MIENCKKIGFFALVSDTVLVVKEMKIFEIYYSYEQLS